MDAERAEQDSEDTGSRFRLIGDTLIELAVCILLEGIGRTVAGCCLAERCIRISRAEGLRAGLLECAGLLEIRLLLEGGLLERSLLLKLLLEIRLRCLLELHIAAGQIVDRLAANLAYDRIAGGFGTAVCAIFDTCSGGESAFRTCNICVEQDLCTISAKHIFVTSFGRVQTGT